MVREALFQILHAHMELPWKSYNVLDLFAGTGALGIEALSRGVRQVVFAEHHASALDLIRRNLDLCGFKDRAKVIRADIRTNSKSLNRILEYGPFNLIFADPPYSQGLGKRAMDWVVDFCALVPGGFMIIEEFKGEQLPLQAVSSDETKGKGEGAKSSLQLVDKRVYGQTELWFYR
jgi:16S rRNA (guanine966-N2)-methyltransferase